MSNSGKKNVTHLDNFNVFIDSEILISGRFNSSNILVTSSFTCCQVLLIFSILICHAWFTHDSDFTYSAISLNVSSDLSSKIVYKITFETANNVYSSDIVLDFNFLSLHILD